jgi:hypothetical protein
MRMRRVGLSEKFGAVTEEDSSEWPPSRDASLLDVLRVVLSRLDAVEVTPWNVWIEPPRKVMITLSERPRDALVHEVLEALAPLEVSPHWHEAFVERPESGSELDDDVDYPEADMCSVCGGPAALQLCELGPPPDGTAPATFWWVCTACRASIAAAEAESLKSRLRPEDRTAPYADALVNGLLRALSPRR